MLFLQVSLLGAINKVKKILIKNFLINKTMSGLSSNQCKLFILALIAFAIIIAWITIKAIQQDKHLGEYYAKRHFVQAQRDLQKRIRAMRGSKDPGIQIAEIERRRKLQEDINRENNRTPSRFKLYELLRELFR